MAIGTPTDPIDFPNNPVHGQVHAENGGIYVFKTPDNVWLGGRQAQEFLLQIGNSYFSHFFLGMLGTDPKVGLEGFVLVGGEVYYNNVEQIVKVYDPTNGWQSVASPTKAVVASYVYTADGVDREYFGNDLDGKLFAFKAGVTQPVEVYVSGVKLVETTPAHVGGYTVDRASDKIVFTRAPRRGAKVVVEILMDDPSLRTDKGPIHTVGNTAQIKASAGATLNDKLAGAILPLKSKVGTLLLVPYIAGAPDNSYAGLWLYDGAKYNHDVDLSSIVGTNMYQTTAATIHARATAIKTDTLKILTADFAVIFTKPANKGDFVAVSSGAGTDAKYAGLYFYNGAHWVATAAAWSPSYSQAFIKKLVGDTDPKIVAQGIPQAAALYTLEKGKKEIHVVDSTGNWVPLFTEATIKEWIAAGSLFQGTFSGLGIGLLPAPAPKNKGFYWTWVGGASTHIDISNPQPVVLKPTDAGYGTADIFNSGDWLQSAGNKWVHVPGDLLSKQRWEALGAIALWSSGSYEKDSIVRWKPTPTAGIHYFKAKQAITTADIDPGAVAGPGQAQNWEDITPAVNPENLGNVVYSQPGIVAPKADDIIQFDGTSWVIKEADTVIRPWSLTDEYKVLNQVVYVNTPADPDNPEKNMLFVNMNPVGNINQDPLTANTFWKPLVLETLTDLQDVAITTVENQDILVYDTTINKFKNSIAYKAFGWLDRDYEVGALVIDHGEWFRALKAITTGMSSPASDTNTKLLGTVTFGLHIAGEDKTTFSALTGTGLAKGAYALVDGSGYTLAPGAGDLTIIGGPFDGVTVNNYVTGSTWGVVNTGEPSVGVNGYLLFPTASASGGGGVLGGQTITGFDAFTTLTAPSGHNWKKLGITELENLDDVVMTATREGDLLTYKVDKWVNTSLIKMLSWEAKEYPQDSVVVQAGVWYQAQALLDATVDAPDIDDGTHWKKMGDIELKDIKDVSTTGFQDGWILKYSNVDKKWIAVKHEAIIPIWTPGRGYVIGQSVLRVPLAGTDTYTGKPKSFIAKMDNNSDPLTTPDDWYVGGSGVPDGFDDDDRLSWDAATQSWVTAANELGYETNIVSREDGGSFVFDEGNNTFDIRRLKTFELEDVSNVVPDNKDVLMWNGTEYTPYDLSVEDMNDVNMSSIRDGQMLKWESATNTFVPETISGSREIFPFDLTAAYVEGNIVEFQEKIYLAKNRPSTYTAPPINTPVHFNNVFATRMPFGVWLSLPPSIGDKFVNDSPADMQVSGNNLIMYTLKPAEGLVWLGVNSRVDITLPSTSDAIVSGMLHDVAGSSSISFNQVDIDAIVAADKAANSPTSGGTPLAQPENWTLIGEKNTSSLADGTATDNLLIWDVHAKEWLPNPNPSYTKAEADNLYMLEVIGEAGMALLNNKIDSVVAGTAHGLEVQDILNTPPTVALEGEVWIVGTTPTGDFVGHANQLAWSDGVNWHFDNAVSKETHYVEQKQGTYNFNGTSWVKIASTTAAIAGTTANGIGEIVGWPLVGGMPDGLLELKGQVLAVSAYPDLYAVIGNTYNNGTAADGVSTFAIPDYRGYVLKGAGRNKNTAGDAGFAPGEHQGDQNKAHRHSLNYGNQFSVVAQSASSFHQAGNTWSDLNPAGQVPGGVMNTEGGAEARVKSIGTRWCMRYKGINAGIRGPSGINYVDGNHVGDTLKWNGTTWEASAGSQLGWIFDANVDGDHGFGRLDSRSIPTVAGGIYKVTASYTASWAHSNNVINLQIKHGGTILNASNATGAMYGGSSTIFATIAGTGRPENLGVYLIGNGGSLHNYTWLIERIK